MRFIVLLMITFVCQSMVIGQQISYNIPAGYENSISSEELKSIIDLAVPIVSKRYQIEKVKDGTIFLKGGQELEALNLHNLIGKCVAVKDKSQWPKVVQEHFDNLFTSIDQQKKIDPLNFETVKKYLSLRIYPASMVEQRGGATAFVVKTDLEGTYTMLMLDLPGAFTPVSRQIFSLWKMDTAQVFRVAQDNVNLQKIEKVTQKFQLDGGTIEISFLGNEDYAASYALDLANNSPGLVGDWGAVVAVPNKGIVDICKITKQHPLDFVKFIQRMKARIEQSFQEHPQKISDHFFWYYKGRFTRISVVQAADGTINVISPFGLSELMAEK